MDAEGISGLCGGSLGDKRAAFHLVRRPARPPGRGSTLPGLSTNPIDEGRAIRVTLFQADRDEVLFNLAAIPAGRLSRPDLSGGHENDAEPRTEGGWLRGRSCLFLRGPPFAHDLAAKRDHTWIQSLPYLTR